MLQLVLGALYEARHQSQPSNHIPDPWLPPPNLPHARCESSRSAFLKRVNNRQYLTTATRIYSYESMHTSHSQLRQSESRDCLVEILLYRHHMRKQRKHCRTTKSG